MRIILASKSPRRKELLKQIGISFECIVSEKEELISSVKPEEAVMGLSKQKAEDVCGMLKENKDFVIIGADTVVASDGEILGKPENEEDAMRMLKRLSGNRHSVWTGVTLICSSGGRKTTETFAVETKVSMYPISDEEIARYIAAGESSDKAGAYAIQGLAAKFISGIEGDYNNVVGLPVAEVYQRLKKLL